MSLSLWDAKLCLLSGQFENVSVNIGLSTVAQSWRWIMEIVLQPRWLKLSWIIFESPRPRDWHNLRKGCECYKFISHTTVMKDEKQDLSTTIKVYLMPHESLKYHLWALACVHGLWLLVLHLTKISMILTFTCMTWILFTVLPHREKLLCLKWTSWSE